MDYRDLQEYQFELPESLIAKFPAEPPDSCRLLVFKRQNNAISEGYFYQLANYLEPGDLLVANDTLVEERRVFLRRATGARLEAIFLEEVRPGAYKVLIKKAKRLQDGELLTAERESAIRFMVEKNNGVVLCLQGELIADLFPKIGQMPIPPYLKREEHPLDREQYQNYFAVARLKSAAAPTAALHFTDRVMESLKQKGVDVAYVSLAVGYGTFAPLREENFRNRSLHKEVYFIPEETALRLRSKDYRRLISIGTTSLRVLETVHRLTDGKFDSHLAGETNLFVFPPDRVRSVHGLITNFHLPGSSLLLLVAAFIGKEKVLEIYRKAIAGQYRFYSYGDAMLLL